MRYTAQPGSHRSPRPGTHTARTLRRASARRWRGAHQRCLADLEVAPRLLADRHALRWCWPSVPAAAPLEPPRRAAPRRWRHASSTACRQAAPCRSAVGRQHTSERARDLVLPAYMRMHMQRGQRTTCWQLNMTWDRAEACATRECLGERARAGWAGTIAPHRHSRRSSMPACMKDSGREKARARFTAHGSRVRDAPSCEVPSDGAGRCCGCMKALRV